MRELACEVCVVGAGPGGLAAAVTAAEQGKSVVLVDDNHAPGGQIWRASAKGALPRDAKAWIDRAQATGLQRQLGTRIVDALGPRELLATTSDGPLLIRNARLVLALGASERFLPFPGWTLPGICGVGGLQALSKGGLDLADRRVAIAGSGPLLLAVAAALRKQGARVHAIFEQASRAQVRRFGLGLATRPRKLAQALRLLRELRGIPRYHDAWPVRADGNARLHAATFRTRDGELKLELDWLAVGFGLVPNTDVAALLGCAIEAERVVVDDATRTSVDAVFAVGETVGVAGVDAAIADGITAGLVAADRPAARAMHLRRRERSFAHALDRAFRLRDELKSLAAPDTIICRCEDVALASLRGHTDAREAKLMTRCGMGPCQGRVCGPALAFVAGFARDRVRPPLIPLTFGELAAFGARDNSIDPPPQQPR